MEITRLSELRPRTVWDIIDDACDLYRERFVPLCAVTAIIGAPAYLAMLAFQAGPYARLMQASVGKNPSPDVIVGIMGQFFGALSLAFPLLMAAQMLQHGAAAVIVGEYLRGRTDTTIRGAYKRLFARPGTMLGIALLYGVFAFVGMCALGIGTLWVWLYLAFAAQIALSEGRGVFGAFRRSRAMVLANGGKTFGLLMLMGLVTALLSSGLSAVIALVFVAAPGAAGGGDAASRQVQQQIIAQSLESLAGLLVAPLQGVALSLLYYDLRVRQEGFDVVARAEEAGIALAPDPFGDLPSDRAARLAPKAPVVR